MLLDPPRNADLYVSRMPMRPARIALPVGGGVLVAGTAMVWAWSTGLVGDSREMPGWILAWTGLLFAAAGLVVLVRAGSHVLRQRDGRRRAAPFGGHRWRRRVLLDDSRLALAQKLTAVALLGGLLLPMNLAVVNLRDLVDGHEILKWYRWLPLIVVGLFDLALMAAAFALLRQLLQAILYGRCRLVLNEGPPVRPGGVLAGRLELPGSAAGARHCDVVLRCVRESQQRRGGTDDVEHRAELLFESRERLAVGPSGLAELRLPVPVEAPTTDFESVRVCYWELVVSIPLEPVSFEAVFLVPVHATP